jgi:hypothetical protein
MPTLRQVVFTQRQPSQTYSFTLILSSEPDDDQIDTLYEKCGDATFGARSGVPYAAFDREAHSLFEAISSAIRDVETTIPGLKVVRIQPDDLVNAMEISRRLHRSREMVRLLIVGERGDGTFPVPAASAGRSPLWRWTDVATWATAKGRDVQIDLATGGIVADDAAFIAAANGALELRKAAGMLVSPEAKIVLQSLVEEGEKVLLER